MKTMMIMMMMTFSATSSYERVMVAPPNYNCQVQNTFPGHPALAKPHPSTLDNCYDYDDHDYDDYDYDDDDDDDE